MLVVYIAWSSVKEWFGTFQDTDFSKPEIALTFCLIIASGAVASRSFWTQRRKVKASDSIECLPLESFIIQLITFTGSLFYGYNNGLLAMSLSSTIRIVFTLILVLSMTKVSPLNRLQKLLIGGMTILLLAAILFPTYAEYTYGLIMGFGWVFLFRTHRDMIRKKHKGQIVYRAFVPLTLVQYVWTGYGYFAHNYFIAAVAAAFGVAYSVAVLMALYYDHYYPPGE